MSISRGTVHSVQFLRFVAASLVVVFHAHLALTTRLPGLQSDEATMYLFGFGASGVHVFFVISGYIMYLTTLARGGTQRPVSFWIRRAIRIYPIYWGFALLYLGIHAAISQPYHIATERLPGALLLWPRDASLIVGPSWTLSFELYFYLIFGLILMAGRRRGIALLTLLLVGSVAVGAVAHPTHAATALMTSSLLLEFVAGAWIARWTTERLWPPTVGWLAVATALAGFAIGTGYGYDRLPSVVAWGLASAILLFGVVVLERGGAVSGIRWASHLGDSSYVLYLSHLLLIDLMIAAMLAVGGRVPVWAMLPVVVVVCIALAHHLHLVIERPLVRKLHRITRRPPDPGSGSGAL